MRKIIVHHFFSFAIIVAIVEDRNLLRFEIHRDTKVQNREGWIYVGRRTKGKSGLSERMVDIGDSKGFLVSDGHEEAEFLPVQVKRNPYKTKGFLLSRRLSLKGDYMVISPDSSPGSSRVKLSRKLRPDCLKKNVAKLNPSVSKDLTVVIRSFAETASYEDLLRDYRLLEIRWRLIEKNLQKAVQGREITCLWRQSFLENLLTEIRDVDGIETNLLTSTKELLKNLKFLRNLPMEKVISLPSFLLQAISESFDTTVSLSGGSGFIVINRTDLGWTVDVNSGSKSKEEIDVAQFQTNCRALRRVGKEMRLRNMTGLILIDCINMTDSARRFEAVDALRSETLQDWNKVKVNNLSYEDILVVVRESKMSKMEIDPIEREVLVMLLELERAIKSLSNGKRSSITLNFHDRELLNYFLRESILEKILESYRSLRGKITLNFVGDSGISSYKKFSVDLRRCSREDSNL